MDLGKGMERDELRIEIENSVQFIVGTSERYLGCQQWYVAYSELHNRPCERYTQFRRSCSV